MPANVENSAVSTGLEKISFHYSPKERQCQNLLNYHTIALISHSSEVMLKILQRGFNSSWTVNFQMFKLDLEKAEEPNQIANICWVIEKAREFQENIYFCFIDYVKTFECLDHNKQWKILKEMGVPDHLTCLLSNLYAGQEATVRTGHRTTDWL